MRGAATRLMMMLRQPCCAMAAQAGGRNQFLAGAGVVADSVPESEYQETVNKAAAAVRAVERARGL